jgi:hypothetical protein
MVAIFSMAEKGRPAAESGIRGVQSGLTVDGRWRGSAPGSRPRSSWRRGVPTICASSGCVSCIKHDPERLAYTAIAMSSSEDNALGAHEFVRLRRLEQPRDDPCDVRSGRPIV